MPKLAIKDRNYKLIIYFLDGRSGTFYGSYKNDNKSVTRLKKLVTTYFKGSYETAIIYDVRTDREIFKYIKGKLVK